MMITSNINQDSMPVSPADRGYELKKVVSYRDHERMGGKIAVWETIKVPISPVDPKQEIENALTTALNVDGRNDSSSDFANALASATDPIADADAIDIPAPQEEFTLGDLFDIVNPLHHIPLINNIYREFTGDTIKPSSQMVGGAIYSGPLGVVAPLVDLVIEEETGMGTISHMAEALGDVEFGFSHTGAESLSNNESNQMVSNLPADKAMRTSVRTIHDILADQTQSVDGADFESVLLRYSNLSQA